MNLFKYKNMLYEVTYIFILINYAFGLYQSRHVNLVGKKLNRMRKERFHNFQYVEKTEFSDKITRK